MIENVFQLIGLVVGYLLIRFFLFKKKKVKKMSYRKRYDLKKNERDK